MLWDGNSAAVTLAGVLPRLRDVTDGRLKRSYLNGRRTDSGHDP